jgi:two-component system LytT family response regulator
MPGAGGLIRALVVDDEAPARAKLRRWLAEQPDVEVIAEAASGLTAAQLITTARPDLVFLDIQMPDISGLEVAAQLQAETAPLIVFVTAHDDHAVEAFDLGAVDYLLKPYDRSRFLRALTRIRMRLKDGARHAISVEVARARLGAVRRLPVPDGDGLKLIDCATIHWLEADDNYVHVHAGDREYLLRRTLQDLLQQLGEERFARIHKSAAVNVSQIAALERMPKGDYEVRLRSGARLRLSRRYASALLNAERRSPQSPGG